MGENTCFLFFVYQILVDGSGRDPGGNNQAEIKGDEEQH